MHALPFVPPEPQQIVGLYINLFSHGFSVGFLVNISFFIWVLYDIHYIISECGEQSSH